MSNETNTRTATPYRFPSDRTRHTAARYGKEDWKDNLSCQAAFQRNEQGNDDR